MGSVLGMIFSNFYMSNLENKIFNHIKNISISAMLMISLFQQMVPMELKKYKKHSKITQSSNLFMH